MENIIAGFICGWVGIIMVDVILIKHTLREIKELLKRRLQ